MNKGGVYVRDARKDPFARVPVALIDRFGAKIRCNGVAVYTVLAAHASRFTRRTFVGYERMAALLGVNEKTIRRAIDLLLKYRIIHRESGTRKGSKGVNQYILRDIEPAKPSDGAPLFEGQIGEGWTQVSKGRNERKNGDTESASCEDEGGRVGHGCPRGSDTDVQGGLDTGVQPGWTNRGGRVGHFDDRNKEEPDRSNQISTTTTDLAVSPAASQSEAVLVFEAMRKYSPAVDGEAVERLIGACRQMAPDATANEICHFIHEKGEVVCAARRERVGDFSTVSSVRNPLGFLIIAVPKCFKGPALAAWRATATAVAETADVEMLKCKFCGQNVPAVGLKCCPWCRKNFADVVELEKAN